LRIDLDSVLWRTRGRTWDYGFVLRPVHPHVETWYDFHADAFSGAAPGTSPISVGGVLLTVDGEKVSFVATAFQDAILKDAAERPVAHYLVWFPSLAGAPLSFEIPADWGNQVIQAFGDEWKTAFSSDGASEDDLLATARAFVKEVPLSDAGGVSIRFDRRVVEKKKRQALPRTSKTNRAFLVIAIAGVLILAFLMYWLTRP
jgi:hypothetical protein